MIKNEEYEVKFADSGIRILIPPAAHLFAEGNKVKHQLDRINVFYLNYFDFWSQTVIDKMRIRLLFMPEPIILLLLITGNLMMSHPFFRKD